MAIVAKIDSNVTGLSYAEETSIGVVSSPTWKPLEPNSYKEFGGQYASVARNPINADRQLKKGGITDLDSSGGISQDFVPYLQDILQGFFFADLRLKADANPTAVSATLYTVPSGGTAFLVGSLLFAYGFAVPGNNGVHAVTASAATTVTAGGLATEVSPPAGAKIQRVGHQGASGDITMTVSGTVVTLGSTALNFTTLGLVPGEWIYIGGDLAAESFATDGCNGYARIKSITATAMVLDKHSGTPATDTGTGKTIRIFFGRCLKNETGSLIKRRTYNIERTLGAPDTAQPAQIQSEYLVGALPNQFMLDLKGADKAMCEMDFIAIAHETRSGVTGVKSGTRATHHGQLSRMFNTSTDFSRIKMNIAGDPVAAPLIGYFTEAQITINNNVSLCKALGTLGGFEATLGNFEVTGSVTGYFSDVAAITAIRDNADVTMDIHMAAYNMGISIDLPLLTLGEGRLSVEQDKEIKIPLSTKAVSGETLLATQNHTALMVFWDYLPNRAM